MRYIFLLLALLFSVDAHAQTLVGDRVRLNNGPCVMSSGSGTPEGAVSGSVCDLYLDTTTGVLYAKWSGIDSTNGWDVGHNANARINGSLSVSGNSDFGGHLTSPAYVSQLTGWRITSLGEGDFRYLFVDELHAKSFIADLEQALAGGQLVCKSVAVLGQNFTNPAPGGTADIVLRDLPSAENMAVFESGDWIGVRLFSRAGGALEIAETYGTVSGYADQAGGTQVWTFTRGSGANAGTQTTGAVVQVEAIVIDYGTSGNGCHETNAIDGIYGLNSPYAQTWTWTTSPISSNRVLRTRSGNLRGITGVSNEYGFLGGTYAATGGQYIKASSQGVELHGVNLSLWDGSTRTFYMDRATPYFSMGNPAPTTYGSGIGLWQGKDAGVYKWRLGNPAGNRIEWDGTNLNIVGTVTVTGGVAWSDITGRPTELTDGRISAALASTGRLLNAVNASPSGSGLFLGADYMGFYSGGAWRTYMDSSGNFYLGGASGALQWNAGTGTLTIAASTVSGNGSGLTSINGGNIQTDTITASQIAANAITTSELNASSVTAAKLNVTSLTSITANIGGTLTAGTISGVTIDGSTIIGGAGNEVLIDSSGITVDAGLGSSDGYKFEGAGIGMFYDTSVNVIYTKASGGFNWERSSAALAYTSLGFFSNSGDNLGRSGNRWGSFFGTTIDITGNGQVDSDFLVDGVIYSTALAGSGRRYLCIENNGAITADNVAC